MKMVAIVILNYLNYRDTIECMDSIEGMNYPLKGIVIVDNGSHNESYQILKKKYKKRDDVLVVRAGNNYGYAKGNNIGIALARKRYRTDFVYVVNNDVIFMDPHFFDKLLEVYTDDVGIIGSEIVLKNGIVQPQWSAYVELKEIIHNYIRIYLTYKDREVWGWALPDLYPQNRKKMLHGCGLLFTPSYFEKYNGFYPHTFLYAEEEILYQMCKRYGLKQVYVKETYIFHKEDQSSEMSFQNEKKIMQKYTFKSYKYVVWWALKNSIIENIKSILRH